MAENLDPVLGGQGPGGFDPVMGGLVAIQQDLASSDPKVRIRALKDALRYGEKGAQLLIQTMRKDKDWEVKFAAWETLLGSEDPKHVQMAKAYRIPLPQTGDIRAKCKAGKRDFPQAPDLLGSLVTLTGETLVRTGETLVSLVRILL